MRVAGERTVRAGVGLDVGGSQRELRACLLQDTGCEASVYVLHDSVRGLCVGCHRGEGARDGLRWWGDRSEVLDCVRHGGGGVQLAMAAAAVAAAVAAAIQRGNKPRIRSRRLRQALEAVRVRVTWPGSMQGGKVR